MKITVCKWLVESWKIKKKDIKDLGVNPDKEYDEITLRELMWVADFLDLTVSDLIDYT